MKKNLVFLVLLNIWSGISAQTTWNLSGNSATNPIVHYLGTSDSKDLIFKTNAASRVVIKATSGNVLIGTVADNGYKLSVNGGILTAFDASISSIIVGRGAGGISSNTVFGSSSLISNSGGSQIAAFGASSLFSNTTGSSNNAFGSNSLYNNTTGSENNAFGSSSLNYNTTGYNNNAFGYQSLYLNTTGSANTAFGNYALYSNTQGYGNSGFGLNALRNNTTGNDNIALGLYALSGNTSGSSNVALGNSALSSNSTSFGNVGIGTSSFSSNTTGYGNTAIGYSTGHHQTTASGNTYVGVYSGFNNNDESNTAIGMYSLYNATSASRTVAIGGSAGGGVFESGTQNIFLGFGSGGGMVSGDYNVIIGANSGESISGLDNYMLFSDGQGMERFRVTQQGNLLLNTTTDLNYDYKLQVNGNMWATGFVLPTDAAAGKVLTSDANGVATWQDAAGGSAGWSFDGSSVGVLKSIGTKDNFDFPIITNNLERVRITSDGNVAIGTDDPKGYRLAVNGAGIFTKVKVKLFGEWPDYVFNPEYQLPSLSEVEQFIRSNKHLPGVPSARELEISGLDVGEGQAILLKKVEELTLYMIELKKENAQLKEEVEKIKKSRVHQ